MSPIRRNGEQKGFNFSAGDNSKMSQRNRSSSSSSRKVSTPCSPAVPGTDNRSKRFTMCTPDLKIKVNTQVTKFQLPSTELPKNRDLHFVSHGLSPVNLYPRNRKPKVKVQSRKMKEFMNMNNSLPSIHRDTKQKKK